MIALLCFFLTLSLPETRFPRAESRSEVRIPCSGVRIPCSLKKIPCYREFFQAGNLDAETGSHLAASTTIFRVFLNRSRSNVRV
jgi:hypothetical protein